jgi:hypothetical protein
MIQAHYRADYAGEFVILETKWSEGQKVQKREFVPNRIENDHISGRAACIGHDIDQPRFDFTRLQRHRGGLLGSKKLQTYGTGVIAQKMKLDFAIETESDRLENLIQNNYASENIVYSSAKLCMDNPNLFYLIPYNPNLLDMCSAVYLAAFDGHKEIFLLGFNKDTPVSKPLWHLEIVSIMNTYAGVRFYLVGEPTNMYDAWLDCANAQAINYREFISYCDV